jgi:formamidopyrimidine-DNA glycosylase
MVANIEMPELPEVETLCSQLKKIVVNENVVDIQIIDSKLERIDEAVGCAVTDVRRRGKTVEIHIDNERLLAIHLRMSGRLYWQREPRDLPAHSRFVIAFKHGSLVCIDPRRFATFSLRNKSTSGAVIEDPLRNFPAERIAAAARKRKLPVKSFLMDQRTISGIGNIYACEILHDVSIDPRRKACSLSVLEWKTVGKAAKRILARAVVCRGTTISDWRDLFGQSGEYQKELKVYAREGLECGRCSGIIRRERLGGRGTYFCPSCQR